ncbi:hypothetical protein [Nguyenibacter sp. L1]|nr:hypothetical protein [Nguyenibacter sp. L1]WRH88429.1 hypothetical protein QN315_01990 [Nguyenibacter sp. L1]
MAFAVLVLLAAGGGFLSLGVFPPAAPTQPVHKDLSADHFARP